MISGTLDRRRRALFWSAIASAVIHLIILTLILHEIARLFVLKGEPEVVSQTSIVTIKKQALSTPSPPHEKHKVRERASAPAITPPHELVKETLQPAPPAPRRPSPSLPSKIERDEAGFSREVAQLNEANDPHAIPTIDPASRESATKSYAFNVPSSMRGDEHGNGIITPVQSWRENGRDCYYGRYEYTYPDGATESGNIVWAFCYDPGTDPFKLPPHPIPFPIPLAGFKLPADTDLPPIEKSVYEQWASANGGASTP